MLIQVIKKFKSELRNASIFGEKNHQMAAETQYMTFKNFGYTPVPLYPRYLINLVGRKIRYLIQ